MKRYRFALIGAFAYFILHAVVLTLSLIHLPYYYSLKHDETKRFLVSAGGASGSGGSSLNRGHNLTLTHVVVPLHEKQIDTAKASLETWVKYPPCNQQLDSDRVTGYGEQKPSLIFQVSYSSHNSASESNSIQSQCMEAFESLPRGIQKCFAGFTVHTLPLDQSQDDHKTGARLMMEEFLQGNVTAGSGDNVGYALYMEPDMIPVRENWLQQLAWQVEWPVPEFFIKGSIFRGNLKLLGRDKMLAKKLHINGNSIYNLASEAFRSFYFDEVRPYVVRKYGDSRNAYDVDFSEYMLDMKNIERTRKIIHLYQYTDSIQNLWHTEYSVEKIIEENPNTLLVHGGTRILATVKFVE